MGKEDFLRKKIERIQKAQEETEKLLEEKSRELFDLNQALEARVIERTAEFEAARDEAIIASKAKSQFLANMSHEIRTPLNGMLGFISLLLKSEMSDVQKQQLRTVSQSGQLLLSIINDILEFSKIEAGKIEIENREFHLETCIEDIVGVLSTQVFDRGLEFSYFIDRNLSSNFIGDESRIRQLLVNLIGNAIKFTPTGEIRVRVESADDGNVRFTVSDTGVGVAKDKLTTIFNSFEQADVSDTRKYGGTGLGLTISREIVQVMGGKIWVESEETKGSEFIFEIPLTSLHDDDRGVMVFEKPIPVAVLSLSSSITANICQRVEKMGGTPVALKTANLDLGYYQNHKLVVDYKCLKDDAIADQFRDFIGKEGNRAVVLHTPCEFEVCSEKFSSPTTVFLLKPVRRAELEEALLNDRSPIQDEDQGKVEHSFGDSKLLLVEDNQINQMVAIAMLEANGFKADIAGNGKEAVEMMQGGGYSLILMDCQMPVMDGFEATKAIRQSHPNLPIIAMTANAFKKTKEECFDVGMNDFVTKPVDGDALAEVISKHLLLSNGG
ncbi:MAG: hypothetical protein CL677_05655 [Bdellovibrionaceae bacterium]|nr:hypothetical protein [Pseudobdellovibrionaceae bacterium]|tara:strand:+ start:14578 stop:16239 length:1662 start_codon:yes stop_codon:yes gene_type:complete